MMKLHFCAANWRRCFLLNFLVCLKGSPDLQHHGNSAVLVAFQQTRSKSWNCFFFFLIVCVFWYLLFLSFRDLPSMIGSITPGFGLLGDEAIFLIVVFGGDLRQKTFRPNPIVAAEETQTWKVVQKKKWWWYFETLTLWDSVVFCIWNRLDHNAHEKKHSLHPAAEWRIIAFS